jgi:hypothetical protein
MTIKMVNEMLTCTKLSEYSESWILMRAVEGEVIFGGEEDAWDRRQESEQELSVLGSLC